MKKAILFDLDGTLWDSAPGVCKAWNTVLARHGMAPDITVEKMHGMMGKQMNVIAAILFPERSEAEQAALMDECCVVEHEVLAEVGGTLYPRLEEILSALCEKYTLGIVSNCQKGYIETFFAAHGLGKYFSDIECYGNTGLSKGENIAAVVRRGGFDKAVYLGDTHGDWEAAVHAGVPFIHAAYGFGSVPENERRIFDISELPAVAAEMLD